MWKAERRTCFEKKTVLWRWTLNVRWSGSLTPFRLALRDFLSRFGIRDMTITLYRVAQKCSTGQKAISGQSIDIFTTISGFTAETVVNNPWKFHWNIFIASRITTYSFYDILFRNLKYGKEMDSHNGQSISYRVVVSDEYKWVNK